LLLKRPVLLCVCFLLLIPIIQVSITSATSTTLAVDPVISTPTVGDTFNVNVTVTNVANFTSWQLTLYFLNSVVNCTNAIEGTFLNGPEGTYFGNMTANNYNSTHGRLLAYSSLLGPYTVNGSGVILIVTFKALMGGSTPLNLSDTKLGDEKIPPQPIPHTTIDGTVQVAGGVHDVALAEVAVLKTIVGQGYWANIKVSAANQGAYTETVNFTIYANTTSVTSLNITIPNGGNLSIIVNWDTTGFAKGNYTISAYAWPVQGETNTANNNRTDGIVTVALAGDINIDGKVDMKDISYLARRFGCKPSSTLWDPNADINNDGKIDMKDIAIVAKNFGKHDP
jgi:hypothetical protein